MSDRMEYEILMEIDQDTLDHHYLMNASAIAFDIETQTESALKKEFKNKYGVSYVADILIVSFNIGSGFPTTIVPFFEGEDADPAYEMRKEFVRRVLRPRSDLTLIGHNVIFDLRALGGHFGFNYLVAGNKRPKVWDTMVMSMLLMMSQGGADTALGSLVRSYKLLPSIEDEMFYLSMKDARVDTLGQEADRLMRYVAIDSEVTYRLYALQREVIRSIPEVTAEATIEFADDGTWEVASPPVTDRPNRYISTKNWKALPTLVEWEQRKLWVAACISIKGMLVDRPYLNEERNRLVMGFMQSLESFREIMDNDLTFGQETLELLPYAVWLDSRKVKTGKAPDPKRWYYAIQWRERWFEAKYGEAKEGEVYPAPLAEHFMYPEMVRIAEARGIRTPQVFTDVPWGEGGTGRFYLEDWLYWRLTGETDDPVDKDSMNYWKASLAAAWYRRYLKLTKPQEIITLLGMESFQMWYVFVHQKKDPPTSEELVKNSFLGTPKLKNAIELHDEPLNWQREAMTEGWLSLSEDALTWYFGLDDDMPIDPLMLVNHNQAQISRIDEFLRHSERDGRVHSVIAPKAITSRGTHTSPNVGNLPMERVRGFFIPDPGMVQFSIDLSNAENWNLGLSSGDNALVQACVSGDFHWVMMEIYKFTQPNGEFTGEYKEMLAEMATGSEKGKQIHATLKKLRKFLKRVTFGSAYGAGAYKVSQMLNIPIAEAEAMLAAKDRRFSVATAWTKRLIEGVDRLYRQGYNPPFVLLWTGRRIPIPAYPKGDGTIRVEGYKGINYVQQGGVAEIVWRSMVLAQEEFLDRGMSGILVNQVHDEIVGQCKPEEFWDVCAVIIKHLAEAVPQQYLNRTIPACRFLSAIGPENADKWGYQHGVEYPIDKTKFLNRWGLHDMPEGETEAPTWVGDLDAGYTVQGEIESRLVETMLNEDNSLRVDTGDTWKALGILDDAMTTAFQKWADFRMPIAVEIGDRQIGPLLFPERMAVYSVMAQRGYDVKKEYWAAWEAIGGTVDVLRAFLKWWIENSPVPTPEEAKQRVQAKLQPGEDYY
jgi:DNA polymerase family A